MHGGATNGVNAWLLCCARCLSYSCGLRSAPSKERALLRRVPGEVTRLDVDPVVVEEKNEAGGELQWRDNNDGWYQAPLWCFKSQAPAPRGAVLKPGSKRAYEPRDYMPSWRQIHEFLGLGGGKGSKRWPTGVTITQLVR